MAVAAAVAAVVVVVLVVVAVAVVVVRVVVSVAGGVDYEPGLRIVYTLTDAKASVFNTAGRLNQQEA